MEVLWGGSYGKMPSIRPTLGKTPHGGLMGWGVGFCSEMPYGPYVLPAFSAKSLMEPYVKPYVIL